MYIIVGIRVKWKDYLTIRYQRRLEGKNSQESGKNIFTQQGPHQIRIYIYIYIFIYDSDSSLLETVMRTSLVAVVCLIFNFPLNCWLFCLS